MYYPDENNSERLVYLPFEDQVFTFKVTIYLLNQVN